MTERVIDVMPGSVVRHKADGRRVYDPAVKRELVSAACSQECRLRRWRMGSMRNCCAYGAPDHTTAAPEAAEAALEDFAASEWGAASNDRAILATSVAACHTVLCVPAGSTLRNLHDQRH